VNLYAHRIGTIIAYRVELWRIEETDELVGSANYEIKPGASAPMNADGVTYQRSNDGELTARLPGKVLCELQSVDGATVAIVER
jgi:hypothetical protein